MYVSLSGERLSRCVSVLLWSGMVATGDDPHTFTKVLEQVDIAPAFLCLTSLTWVSSTQTAVL
jgi:hypothetical protein